MLMCKDIQVVLVGRANEALCNTLQDFRFHREDIGMQARQDMESLFLLLQQTTLMGLWKL